MNPDKNTMKQTAQSPTPLKPVCGFAQTVPIWFMRSQWEMVPVMDAPVFKNKRDARPQLQKPVGSRSLPASLSTGFRLTMIGLFLLGVSGCASYPIGKQFRAQASATKDVSFRAICENPGAYQGRMVIWGGRILTTVNETNGDFVTILQAPLDARERPGSTKLSQGRFIVRSSEFLDPEVYRPGAKITVAGVLSGTEAQKVGNRSYDFPVVKLRDVCFWRPESAAAETPVYYVAPPFWGWDWYGPYRHYDDDYHGYYYRDLDRDWDTWDQDR